VADAQLALRDDVGARQGKHNALQKGAYVAMPVVAALIVLCGYWSDEGYEWYAGV
jgi:hypothetical protein